MPHKEATYEALRHAGWWNAVTGPVFAVFGVVGIVATLRGPAEHQAVFVAFLVLWILFCLWISWSALHVPKLIRWQADGSLLFVAPLRSTRLRPREIRSIANRKAFLHLRHENGRLRLNQGYRRLDELLARLREANPKIQLKGL